MHWNQLSTMSFTGIQCLGFEGNSQHQSDAAQQDAVRCQTAAGMESDLPHCSLSLQIFCNQAETFKESNVYEASFGRREGRRKHDDESMTNFLKRLRLG